MSATTILESYDTQMDYSGDFDVAMHTAGSSSENWPYQSETIMDQDAHDDSQSTGAVDRESVEVDMEETYLDRTDHESVEYEMVDEEENYPHEGGDLLDVEVYDASRLQSPATMPATIDTPQMASGELVDFSRDTAGVFTDPRNSVEASTHLHEHSADEIHAIETVPDSSPHFEVHEEPSVPVEALNLSHTQHPDTSTDGQAIADHIPHVVLKARTEENVIEPSQNVVTYAEDAGHTHNVETELVPTWLQDHETVAHSDQLTESENPEPAEYSSEIQQYYDSNETPADTADPHEISEGVYIDPPPAVLLTLPSSDRPEICLFNQPSARGGSLSPAEDIHKRGNQILTLLLHHRPTLYYEPLPNVFEALRQEEYITRIPEFAEGELALDAHDLQLSVSEDNAHAREVTLHDLNVLHDGSNLSGPLRLRLHVVVPRFILRYHMLRDQIARLNLVAEGGEEDEQVVTHNRHYEARAEEYHDSEEYRENVAQHEEHNEEQQGQQPDQQYNEQSANGTDLLPLDSTDKQLTGDISNLMTDNHNYQQVYGEDTEALGNENEYLGGDVETGTDTDRDLDNSVATGNPEPTKYEDYIEVAECEDRYGEVLPEHDGGDSKVDSNQASDDQRPTNVDTAQDAPPEPDIVDAVPPADLPELTSEQSAEEDHFSEGGNEETFEETNKTEAEIASHDDQGAANKQDVSSADKSDLNSVAILKHEADFTNPEPESSASDPRTQGLELIYPELGDDHGWDDDLDADGDIDDTWPVDHDDDVSNQSSNTLSSTTSHAKRGYEELDSENEFDGADNSTQRSPHESKRSRVA